MRRRPLHVPAKLELHGEDGEEREVHAPYAGCGREGVVATGLPWGRGRGEGFLATSPSCGKI
jgi:hypothetical protein